MGERYTPMTMGEATLPTSCCAFAVVDRLSGIEVCRVWEEKDARRISTLLNADFRATMEQGHD